jgi:hypothetical protein
MERMQRMIPAKKPYFGNSPFRGNDRQDLFFLLYALGNYLKTVTLSEAKGLACQKERFFAALRMTRYVLR